MGIWFKNRRNSLYKFYLPGLLAKIFGAVGFCIIYKFYYGYGDSLVYFKDSLILTEALKSDFYHASRVFFQGAGETLYETNYITHQMQLFNRDNDTFTVVKIAAIVNLFSFSNYYGSTLIFSFLSYFGIWKFYQSIVKKFPKVKAEAAFAILFFPSVFFWGSGLMKDTLVIGFLGYFISAFIQIIEKKNYKPNVLGIAAISIIIIFLVKAYVMFALVPTIIIWWVMYENKNIKNKVIKLVILPVLISAGVILIGFSLQYLSQFTKSYSLDTMLETAQSYQKNHYGDGTFTEEGQGSSYTLGEYDPTLWGIIKKFPAAVIVTYFRPFLWEVRNPVMLLAALESFFVLIITLYILIGLGIKKITKVLIEHPFVLMSLIFSIFFGFAVGFTSYNFGALVRYKIPCIPFFLITLFVLNHELKVKKVSKWKINRPKQFENATS